MFLFCRGFFWCCVFCEGKAACVRGVCVLFLRRSPSGSQIPFNLWLQIFLVLQEAIIGGLQSETTYSVTVAAYTTKGDGARSKAKVITTTGAGQSPFYLGYNVKHRICANHLQTAVVSMCGLNSDNLCFQHITTITTLAWSLMSKTVILYMLHFSIIVYKHQFFQCPSSLNAKLS